MIDVFGATRDEDGRTIAKHYVDPNHVRPTVFAEAAEPRSSEETKATMIPRYSRPEMTGFWEAEDRFRIWFEIEAHACDAQAELGVIPRDAAQAVWQRGRFEVERIDEIERETRHDVIAFLTNLAEHIGPEARFLHQGMTSSDVLDTCLAVQLTQASDILLGDLDGLLAALKARAFEHRHTVVWAARTAFTPSPPRSG